MMPVQRGVFGGGGSIQRTQSLKTFKGLTQILVIELFITIFCATAACLLPLASVGWDDGAHMVSSGLLAVTEMQ